MHERRLRWRCRRGMRELDLLLSQFLHNDYRFAPAADQAAFEYLLSLQDPEIVDLLARRLVTDDPALNHVVERLLGNS